MQASEAFVQQRLSVSPDLASEQKLVYKKKPYLRNTNNLKKWAERLGAGRYRLWYKKSRE